MGFGSVINLFMKSSENVTKPAGLHVHIVFNIWLNISSPFSTQLGAFNNHPQASGCHLPESFTTPHCRLPF